ncbi:uncharacterized protein LOC126703805 [Quercus robur]|uniref:uncharacterized protein LOC126703805 n=1 Tax=Quercus robur TaxID=38942 RepID=UPI0021618C9B|nr:uncharacterized protein LOC126703805 [Quercus robur]
MVTHRGIEANPNQIKVINSLQPPHNPKEVQKLTGMTTALNWFISRLVDRRRPFFLLINKWKGFEWTEECALAFQQLKKYLSYPPIMSSLEIDEVLFAYIVVAPHAVSLVLTRVDSGIQRPVYYVSKSLHEAKVRYLPLEKVILAVVHGTRKLPHYFQAYTEPLYWKVYVDGAANQGGSRVGLVLVSPEKLTIEKSLRLGFSVTNNEARYEALLEGMSMVQKMGGKAMKMFSDSMLVVSQVKGELEAKDERMQGYSTPAYPQENGQVEAVNKVIVNEIKKRLDDTKGRWVEELPHVLWTYRTTLRRSIREILFSMTYGAKAVIPLETGFPTLKTSSFNPSSNNELLEKNLDFIEERRESAMVQLAYYQHKLK